MVPFLFLLLLQFAFSQYNDVLKENYDFIVVGGGAAGCVLASRLTEDNFASVLLLEAGSMPTMFSEIPITAPRLKTGERGDMVWFYPTAEQTVGFKGSVNRTGRYAAGHMVGGGTGINGMLYCRGSPVDYDQWEKRGATGWGYEEILPLFKKLEDFLVDAPEIDMGYHGTGGMLTVTAPNFESPLKQAYLEAAREMGYPINDLNGDHILGFSSIQTTIRGGFRCSTERAYLQPAYDRPNFQLITDAYVTKVEIDSNLVARGVHYTKNNQSYYVEAQREVILSGGTIRSPQMLMLSGIGPKSELDRLGIPVKVDLPGVGQNFHDHVAAFGPIFTVNITDGLTSHQIKAIEIPENVTYPLGGILSSPGLNEVLAFFKSDYEDIPGDYPDTEFTIGFLDYNDNFNDQAFSYLEPYLNRIAFRVSVMNNHPRTYGNISLPSSNPFDFPKINYDYLSDENGTDLKILVDGLKIANQFGRTEALKKLGAEPITARIPGCEMYDMLSDEYLECHAVTLTASWNHGVGTCRMGDPSDQDVVVDPSLRVIGVSRLRVIDSSIMPKVMSANIMGPTIVIGEKGADMIIKEYLAKDETSPNTANPSTNEYGRSVKNKFMEQVASMRSEIKAKFPRKIDYLD